MLVFSFFFFVFFFYRVLDGMRSRNGRSSGQKYMYRHTKHNSAMNTNFGRNVRWEESIAIFAILGWQATSLDT